MNKLLLPALTVSFLTACNSVSDTTPTKTSATVPEGYELEWYDEFNGNTLDLTKWAYRTDNKHQSIQLKENVSLVNGALFLDLNVLEQKLEGQMASGAGVVSKRNFQYGYYEVRSRLGDGIDDDKDGEVDEGWHHSFWIQAAAFDDKGEVNTTYPGIRRTEIDVYENPTHHKFEPEQNGLNNFTQHIIVWDETGKEWGRLPKPPTDVTRHEDLGKDFDANKWNVYGMKWTKDTVTFYVNGKMTKVAQYPADQFTHDNINVWLTAIAANWVGKNREKSSAEYDYFRFYKKS